ncbi:MAG: hypothetical protein ACM3SX_19455 [Deltaproteobacteria bacterium]
MTLASALRTPLDPEPRDFSIILGGPLFQLLRRAHISGDALELVRRRVVVMALLAWLPLLVLCIASGDAFGGAAAVPFVKDVQVHVRFLIAMPLLIVAELVVHQRLRPVAFEFLTRGLVPSDAVGRFQEKLAAAMRLRNSVSAEVLMIVVVYAFGVPVVWRQIGAIDVATWYAASTDGRVQLTLPGIWYAYVSVPLFQFLMLRWYFRLIVWMRFLWSVSRIRLDLHAMHADRMAGLGFLSTTVFAFVPLAMAHGALLSGTIANRIFYAGQTLMDARFEIAIVVVFLLILVLGPLTVFAPQVAHAKHGSARIFGRLSQRYVQEFEATWLPGGAPATSSPLGTSDIQSLADLGNSFETIHATRFAPITRDAVLGLAIATLAPVAPLLFTVIPAEEIAKHLVTLIL